MSSACKAVSVTEQVSKQNATIRPKLALAEAAVENHASQESRPRVEAEHTCSVSAAITESRALAATLRLLLIEHRTGVPRKLLVGRLVRAIAAR